MSKEHFYFEQNGGAQRAGTKQRALSYADAFGASLGHITGQVGMEQQILSDSKRSIDKEQRRDKRVVLLKLNVLVFETVAACAGFLPESIDTLLESAVEPRLEHPAIECKAACMKHFHLRNCLS
jgi:hypothetical protein